MKALNPTDIYPCTVDEEHWNVECSMKALFGPFCDATYFAFDQEMQCKFDHSDELTSSRPQSQDTLGSEATARACEILGVKIPSLTREHHNSQLPTSSSLQEIKSAEKNDRKRPSSEESSQKCCKRRSDAPFHMDAEDLDNPDSQLSIPESTFLADDSQTSQTSSVARQRLLSRQEAYRAARSGDSKCWADLVSLQPTMQNEEIEL